MNGTWLLSVAYLIGWTTQSDSEESLPWDQNSLPLCLPLLLPSTDAAERTTSAAQEGSPRTIPQSTLVIAGTAPPTILVPNTFHRRPCPHHMQALPCQGIFHHLIRWFHRLLSWFSPNPDPRTTGDHTNSVHPQRRQQHMLLHLHRMSIHLTTTTRTRTKSRRLRLLHRATRIWDLQGPGSPPFW
jgi:hypothetical protein